MKEFKIRFDSNKQNWYALFFVKRNKPPLINDIYGVRHDLHSDGGYKSAIENMKAFQNKNFKNKMQKIIDQI